MRLGCAYELLLNATRSTWLTEQLLPNALVAVPNPVTAVPYATTLFAHDEA